MNANKFIIKLSEMLKQFPQIMNWSTDGRQLQIHNVQAFTTEVHPLYFNSSNYKSFLRQLNMYNFKKMSKKKNSISFRHPSFVRGQEHLFDTIRRRKQNHKDFSSNASLPLKSQIFSSSLTDLLKFSSPAQENLRKALTEIKLALKGGACEAVQYIENQLQRLLTLQNEKQKSDFDSSFEHQGYLSMNKIQELVQAKTEPFTQSNCDYLDSNIFNHAQYFQQ